MPHTFSITGVGLKINIPLVEFPQAGYPFQDCVFLCGCDYLGVVISGLALSFLHGTDIGVCQSFSHKSCYSIVMLPHPGNPRFGANIVEAFFCQTLPPSITFILLKSFTGNCSFGKLRFMCFHSTLYFVDAAGCLSNLIHGLHIDDSNLYQ